MIDEKNLVTRLVIDARCQAASKPGAPKR